MQKPGSNDHSAQPGPITLDQGLKRLPTPDGKRSVALFEHGTLQVKLYAPRGVDPQTPHTRDEVYVVVGGSGLSVGRWLPAMSEKISRSARLASEAA